MPNDSHSSSRVPRKASSIPPMTIKIPLPANVKPPRESNVQK